MPLTKKQVIAAIEAMPQKDVVTAEEVIEEILLLEKIEEGLKDLEEGRIISHEDLKKEMQEWSTK